MEDSEVVAACELCDNIAPIDVMSSTADGCNLCPSCQAKSEAAFQKCEHAWEPDVTAFDEPAQYCPRCLHIVCDDAFPSLFGVPAPARSLQ